MARHLATLALLCWLLPLVGCARASEARASDAPRELGAVDWGRDVPAALAASRQTGRPALVLFQEVPGCATCTGFGDGALSDPLLVEAAESAFVPVAVFNNRAGADRAALGRFGEPSWNNPVVRFVDADGRDLIPRRDGVYRPRDLAQRMARALRAAGREVPAYLDWIDDDARSEVARATFVTHCFWEGESCFGSEPGVRSTRASWHERAEVVEVWYDPRQLDHASLLARARERGCADGVVVASEAERDAAARVFGAAVVHSTTPARPAPDRDQKRHLRHSALSRLPLSRLQQTRINAALAGGRDPTRWLSPRQRAAAAVR